MPRPAASYIADTTVNNLNYPAANDFSVALTLEPRKLQPCTIWQAGVATLDCIALSYEVASNRPIVTVVKRSLGTGQARVSAAISMARSIRMAFRTSATAGLELYINGNRLVQDLTPAAKASLSLSSNELPNVHTVGVDHVLLIKEWGA